MKNPKTKEEWQLAVDSCKALLAIDAAWQYGLVSGGPEVNVKRCLGILELGEKQGIVPSADCIERCLVAWQEA